MDPSAKTRIHYADSLATAEAQVSLQTFDCPLGLFVSPERVVGLGKLRNLEIPYLKIANVVHWDLELHRNGSDLRRGNMSRERRARHCVNTPDDVHSAL